MHLSHMSHELHLCCVLYWHRLALWYYLCSHHSTHGCLLLGLSLGEPLGPSVFRDSTCILHQSSNLSHTILPVVSKQCGDSKSLQAAGQVGDMMEHT